MLENSPVSETEVKDLSQILREIERKVLENRQRFDDVDKTLKDFRRIFDQQSSKMNQAIFNGASSEETFQETLNTISILTEILLHTRKAK